LRITTPYYTGQQQPLYKLAAKRDLSSTFPPWEEESRAGFLAEAHKKVDAGEKMGTTIDMQTWMVNF
jgi:hypothetical protein